MRELVIVIADLYFRDPVAGGAVRAPGLERIARLGASTPVGRGWRSWLAERVGRPDLAALPPARVAASLLELPAEDLACASFAVPVHLSPGVAGVHLHGQGLLDVDDAVRRELAADFERTFSGSGCRLLPLVGRELLAVGPVFHGMDAPDPARCLEGDVVTALSSGPVALRRLAAEIEMWLHAHPVNEKRARRGEAAISTLWFWGGTPAETAARSDAPTGRMASPARALPAAFADDAFVAALWRQCGAESRPLPGSIEEVLASPEERGVLVTHAFRLLDRRGPATREEALAAADREWIAPAVGALGERLERLTVVLSDRELRLRARDRLKFWRRAADPLQALQ